MQEDDTQIRKHIRHVTGLPVEVRVEQNTNYLATENTATNISLGGISFIANDRLDIAETIAVNFPLFEQEESIRGRVIWCEKTRRGYEVGLEFDNPEDVERLKIIEYTLEIERYQQELASQQGRQLSALEASREWASRFAGEFSALD